MKTPASGVVAALALALLAQTAAAQNATAPAGGAGAAEHGRPACHGGESWCDGRCCGASWFHYQRHHCGRVRDVRERPGLGKGGL